MPIPQTIQVNPLDLQGNIAIGVALPFNAPGIFRSTYTTKDQVKSNLVNLLLTTKGERVMNPEFGCGLKKFIFEGITNINIENLKQDLLLNISIFIPEITVTDIVVIPDYDSNIIDLNVNYYLNISQLSDQVTVQFQ
jgi:phage baseplate assembly protein W